MTTRRTLLGGVAGAAALAPFLLLEQAVARAAGASDAALARSAAGLERLAKVPGLKMRGDEQVAMLLYPEFTALDLVGPHYFFACMMGAKVHLVTNQPNLMPVASDLGLAISPTIDLKDCPRDLAVLFVPGGTSGTIAAMEDDATMAFVADRGRRAQHVTSVCTGSLVLAAAGLLDGKRATSHWVIRDALAAYGAIPVDARVVSDGNVVTGAGVSAGLDFALEMVAALRGRPYAEALMLQAEYAPEPPLHGGTRNTTRTEIATPMEEIFAPFRMRVEAMARGKK